MKRILTLLLLLLPLTAFANPQFGFGVRAGPVWRESSKLMPALACQPAYLSEDHAFRSDFAVSFEPRLQLNEQFSVVGIGTHLFDTKDQEYAVQVEYLWPPRCPDSRAVSTMRSGASSRLGHCRHCSMNKRPRR